MDDVPEAIADIESAIELADPDTASQLETALDALNSGDVDEGQELLSSLSGLPEHEEEEAHRPEDEEGGDEHGDEEKEDDHAER